MSVLASIVFACTFISSDTGCLNCDFKCVPYFMYESSKCFGKTEYLQLLVYATWNAISSTCIIICLCH